MRTALVTWRDSHGRRSGLPRPSPAGETRGWRRASRGQRVLAWFLDVFPFYLLGLMPLSCPPVAGWCDPAWQIVTTSSGLAAVLAWPMLLDSWGGGLPGRRLMGIRLVRRRGGAPGPIRVFLRAAVANPLAPLVLASTIPLIAALLNRAPLLPFTQVLAFLCLSFPLWNLLALALTRQNTLHDFLLDTLVVQDAPVIALE